jgi:hypothetical protein
MIRKAKANENNENTSLLAFTRRKSHITGGAEATVAAMNIGIELLIVLSMDC